jgi:hypothetical protein
MPAAPERHRPLIECTPQFRCGEPSPAIPPPHPLDLALAHIVTPRIGIASFDFAQDEVNP